MSPCFSIARAATNIWRVISIPAALISRICCRIPGGASSRNLPPPICDSQGPEVLRAFSFPICHKPCGRLSTPCPRLFPFTMISRARLSARPPPFPLVLPVPSTMNCIANSALPCFQNFCVSPIAVPWLFPAKCVCRFLDHRIAEYLFAVPETLKINGTTAKVILRQAAQGRIPDKVLHRNDRKEFEIPQGAWLLGRCAAGPRASSTLLNCGSAAGLIRRWPSRSGNNF